MNGVRTIQGWEWGSCSDNINYGVSYAQRFLDQREHNLDSVPAPSDQDIARALVHFHNNAAGRRVSHHFIIRAITVMVLTVYGIHYSKRFFDKCA